MTPNPTTPAPTMEEWMRSAAREIFGPRDGSLGEAQSAVNDGTIEGFGKMLDLANDWASAIIARNYAAAHPAGTEERAQSQAERDFTDAINIISSLEKERDSLTTALAEAKARCAELTEKLTDTMDARNVAWLDLAHMKVRAETAEAQRDRMKVALESVEVLEEYSGKAGRRQYGKLANVWLYPGDAIATISIRKLSAALSTPPAEEKP